jgi:hypothetical protein
MTLDRALPFALGEERRVAFCGIGGELDEDVQQFRDARTGSRRDKAHRHEMPVTQCLFEGCMQLIGGDFSLLEVERHQFLVDLDHLIDQRTVRVGHRRKIRIPGGVEKAVHHPLAVVGRQVDRQAFPAERDLDGAQQSFEISVFRVDLVDDDEAALCASPPIPSFAVIISMPADALTTTAAVSTASWSTTDEIRNRGVDHVDTRSLRLGGCGTDARSECCHAFSADRSRLSSSAFNAARYRGRAALASNASASVVLPAAPWPTSASVRISLVANCGMVVSPPSL